MAANKIINKDSSLTAKLELKLKSTKVLPRYMSDIYLDKLQSKKFSQFWVFRLTQILTKLEKLVTNK